MKGRFRLDEFSKLEIKNILIAILEYINKHKDIGIDGISLNPIDTSPSQIIDILQELEYQEYNADFNGWEGNARWYFSNLNGQSIILSYCGYEFSMSISLKGEDENE